MSTVDIAGALWLLVAALGLALPVSYAGLPVLGQGAFVAVGAVGVALLGPGGAGLPLLLAVALAVVAAALLGQLAARGAARLAGPYLALATWALAWLVYRTLLAYPSLSGGVQGLVRPAPAHLVSPLLGADLVLTPLVHVVVAAGVVGLVVAATVRVGRGPGGLDLAALRADPDLAQSLGIPVARRRRAILTACAALGGLSGAGTTLLLGVVAPADVGPLLSLQLFVAVLLGGTARWWGAVAGVAVLTALPTVAERVAGALGLDPQHARGVLTAALLAAVLAVRGYLGHRLRRIPVLAGADADPVPDLPPASEHPLLLEARGIRASYTGVRALDGVSVRLHAGQVHAVVGPNGSGKSTLLRVLAGALEPDSGVVLVRGRPAPPGGRVGLGVVRTPQRTVLLSGLSARQQVAIGARGGMPVPFSVSLHLVGTSSARAATTGRERVVARCLRATGLAAVGDVDAVLLTTGQQRLLQVARAAATGSEVLLLDEPAAGMSADERVRLRQVLRLLAAGGAAVVLVEHDMRLVGAVASRVTVLDAGTVVAEGTPEEIRRDPAVRLAFLGPEGGD